MSVYEDPQRNFIDGEWHRIRINSWTYTDPVNRITTFCGKTADDPPYWVPRFPPKKREPEGPECAACEQAAWQAAYEGLMQAKP